MNKNEIRLLLKTLYYLPEKLSLYFHFILFFPHIIALRFHKNKNQIWQDINGYSKQYNIEYKRNTLFIHLMKNVKWFRNQFYFRIKPYDKIISKLCPPDSTLQLHVHEIKGGLVFHHPFSTILNAKYIGENCIIRHLTTLGNKNMDQNQIPTILDNVNIGVGSIIIGNIVIGNNCTIAAGSIVVKDVPDNCVVAGNPAKIIYQDGIRVKN